jgi:hypothetical protein
MKLNPKLTGGLAWAGLIVVLAVPSADLLTRQDSGAAAVITSDTDPVRTATVVSKPRETVGPTATGVASTDPVDQYLQSGKKLPSYISDAPAEVAAQKPAPTVKLVVPSQDSAAQPEAVEVASLEPSPVVVPPQPYPASMRPRAPVVTTASVEESPLIIDEEPLIIDESLAARRDAAVARVLEDDFPQSDRVEGDMLEEWDSGSLADYLERRGLMAGESQTSTYDPDGFFLDEGPNSQVRRPVRRAPPREFFLF